MHIDKAISNAKSSAKISYRLPVVIGPYAVISARGVVRGPLRLGLLGGEKIVLIFTVKKIDQQRVAVGTRKRACHFWSPVGVRRRPQLAAAAAASATADRGAAPPSLLLLCV